ncbi:hypothetical protein [Cellulomonas endophytica]|uniref:hypothetical protein n=1 Tax=Cellulomonas endophytica TaxID=2494735 RepID=UPI001010930B|nr:hypothetical protein [Cellulomonas endophytica]
MAGIERARVAKAHLASALAGRADVADRVRGIGLRPTGPAGQPGAPDYELLVNLSSPAPGAVPTDVDGVGVRVRVVGDVVPLR